MLDARASYASYYVPTVCSVFRLFLRKLKMKMKMKSTHSQNPADLSLKN
jgi:hypothetical protein